MLVIGSRNGRDTKGNCHAVAGSNVSDIHINVYVAIRQKSHYMYKYIPKEYIHIMPYFWVKKGYYTMDDFINGYYDNCFINHYANENNTLI